jgi:lysozyme family protein
MDMIDRLISREGGARITRDPVDPGGVTKFGISKKAYPELDIEKLTYEEAKDLYIKDYYFKYHIHLLPEELREMVFDYSVHSGGFIAVSTLQRLSGVKPDGVIGPQTLAALKSLSVSDLKRAYAIDRIGYLTRQIQAKPSKIKYLVGWVSRVLSLCT